MLCSLLVFFYTIINPSFFMYYIANIFEPGHSFKYSGTSIYRSRNDRFPACTVRHFWSRMKFRINNVIYSRIHRSPNYRFTALIVCKSWSLRSISRMDRLKKKIEAKYLSFALPSLWTINLATQ